MKKLEITEPQFKALVNIIECAHSVLEEDIYARKDLYLIKRMFTKNGYNRILEKL